MHFVIQKRSQIQGDVFIQPKKIFISIIVYLRREAEKSQIH